MGGGAPVAGASVRKLAELPAVQGIVEVNRGDHPDEVWTDEKGDGYNMLGKMLYHIVKALRLPASEQRSYLAFESLRGSLHTIARVSYVY